MNDPKNGFAKEIVREEIRQQETHNEFADNSIGRKFYRQLDGMEKGLIENQATIVFKPDIGHSLSSREGIPIEKSNVQNIQEWHQANNK